MSEPLHLESRGRDGPTLVFLHAFASSGGSFSTMIKRLAPTRRCVTIDLRGFGRSPEAADYSIDQHAIDVIAALRAMSPDAYVLVGHSMGGKVAMAAAAMRPAGLVGLALLAPSPPTPEPISDEQRTQRLASHGDAAIARRNLAEITRAPLAAVDFDGFVADALACSASAWAWWLEAGSRDDISASIPSITVPITVTLGGDDPVIPLATLQASLLSAHPSIALMLLAETGHLLPIERSKDCADELERFAAALPPTYK